VTILALETSGPACRVALASWARPPRRADVAIRTATVIRREGRSDHARHAEILFDLMEAVLRAGGRGRGRPPLAGVTGVAVSIGPGSFTGLRVGLAAAKTFARFGNLPLVGVSTLEALALGAIRPGDRDSSIVPTIDALRGEVYAAVYRARAGRLTRMGGPWILDPDQLANRMPAGARRVDGQPEAATIAALAAVRLAAGRHDDPDRLVPVYLREPAAVLVRRATPGR
jgi:tRNA threonylcarbamoyl adenosine modification protein YeaZ